MQSQKKVIILSIAVGFLLMMAKFIAFFITSSNAILTDAAESIVNVLASGFAFYSIYLSAQPRDVNHPYGHGKVEFFSVFIEGSLILLAGVIILLKSAYNFIYPNQITALLSGTMIVGVAGLVNFFLGKYLIKQSKLLNSLTLYGDGKHLLTDAYTSSGLVVGLILIHYTGLVYLDSILSVAIGAYVVFSGYRLVRKSVSGLMDESDIPLIADMVSVLNAQRKESWIDLHNFRTQRYGQNLHVDCHLTLPYYFDLSTVHDEVSQLDRIVNQDPGQHIEFFIHADPCIPECCHYCRMKNCPVRSQEKTKDIVWTIDNVVRNEKHFSADE